MLRELSVHNLAIIEDVRVELGHGFSAWTGETGAGKSLLLGAIGLLLGERGSADLIRTGQDELRITGAFELDRSEQLTAVAELLQTEVPENELILTRRLSRSGRSAALVNEVPVSVATLKKLGEMLVDIHGQRESYSLLMPAYQLEVLDAFGKLGERREKYQTAAEKVRELRQHRNALIGERQTRQRELALLRFEREELEGAKLVPGETAKLTAERDQLLNAQELAQFHNGVAARLYDEEGCVAEVLSRIMKEAQTWGRIDPAIAEVAKRLEALKPEIQDIAVECRQRAEAFEPNPERLNVVERRLQLLKKLEVKYGRPSADLIPYRDGLAERERTLQKQEDDLGGIDKALASSFTEVKSAAEDLSKARAKVAKKLAAEAEKQLADLGMPKAKLEASLERISLGSDPGAGELPADGADRMELILTANPGEPARPLRKVASGGELSRTMLALKTVLAAYDPVRTLVVFDEIDANVGGRLGDMLGRKLAALSQSHQVLCVTHLAQVASFAGKQWSIRKAMTGKRTTTTIVPLATDAARVEELAMMLRGSARTETTLKEAEEMLKASRKPMKR
jgi:DNA repair protein RecN (Recombination protein N)